MLSKSSLGLLRHRAPEPTAEDIEVGIPDTNTVDNVLISDEVLAATPVCNIRQVEWYETCGGYLARIDDQLDQEWSVFVRDIDAGWYADFRASLSPYSQLRFGLKADDDTEARMAAIDLLRQMSWNDDYLAPKAWVEGK